MTFAQPPKRERLVLKGERKAITARMKAESWQATNGCCYICGASVPMTGPGVEYDHKLPLWLHGKHNVANIGPACPDPCHKAKTKREAPVRAKVVRLQKARAGEVRAKRKIPSRGFEKSDTPRPIAKRADPWRKGRSFPTPTTKAGA